MDETGTVYRSVMLTIVDSSRYEMDLQEVGLVNTATWVPGQAPVLYQEIPSNSHVIWVAQTTTPRTGVSGYLTFAMPQGGILQLNWDLPWVEPFTYKSTWLQQYDQQLTASVVPDCGDPAHVNLQLTLFVEYVVQPNDTFDDIAHKFDIPVQRLYAAVNGSLEPGMHIVIPPPDADEE